MQSETRPFLTRPFKRTAKFERDPLCLDDPVAGPAWQPVGHWVPGTGDGPLGALEGTSALLNAGVDLQAGLNMLPNVQPNRVFLCTKEQRTTRRTFRVGPFSDFELDHF